MWINKYKPKTIREIFGQPGSEIVEFVENFERYKKKKKRGLLIYGPTGCGKTAAVEAIAAEKNLELVELNASDFRNKEQISQIVGQAIGQMSLFAKSKMILVDEVDGMAGREDRGGLSELLRLLAKTPFPIVITANDVWNSKFSSLRRKTKLVEFKAVSDYNVYEILKKICLKEGISFEEIALKQLARTVGGDVRAGINDLQTLAKLGKIDKESLELFGERDKQESIFQALMKIFKTRDAGIAIKAFDNIQENFDRCFMWLEENISKEYIEVIDLDKGVQALSRADIFRGRITKWQHWRFLVYVNLWLTAGVALAKKEKNKSFVKYQQPKRLLKIWIANRANAKRKSIAQKIAVKTHCAAKDVFKDIEYYKLMFKKNKKEMADYFDLDDGEREWLEKPAKK